MDDYPHTAIRFLALAVVFGTLFYVFSGTIGDKELYEKKDLSTIGFMTYADQIYVQSAAIADEKIKKEEIKKEKLQASVVHKEPSLPPPPPPPAEEPPKITQEVQMPAEDRGDPNSFFDITTDLLSYYGMSLQAGNTPNFSVRVKNIGEKTLPDSFYTQLFYDRGNDGVIDTAFQKLITPPLEPGLTESKIWRTVITLEEGTHRMEACADIDRVIVERDEKNCISIVFEVQGVKIDGDVSITNFTFTPQTPQSDENVAISGIVQNNDIAATKSFSVTLYIDGSLKANRRIYALNPQGFEMVNFGTIWKAVSGEHQFKLCADSKEEILETNEENNCVVSSIVVP